MCWGTMHASQRAMRSGWLVVFASLISAAKVNAVVISITVGACLDQREIKRDVLRRLVRGLDATF